MPLIILNVEIQQELFHLSFVGNKRMTVAHVTLLVTKGEKNWLELLELADRAVDGLPFHQHLPVVKECVDICSRLYETKSKISLCTRTCRRLLVSVCHMFLLLLQPLRLTRWKFDQPSPVLRSESQKLLLKLLAHPSAPVRTEAYQRTLDLLKVGHRRPQDGNCLFALWLLNIPPNI